MTKHVEMFSMFGVFCADGRKAMNFFTDELKAEIDAHEKIEFDFTNVRSMNSSFSNALFANIVAYYGTSALDLIVFKNCSESVKLMISSALHLGLKRHENKHRGI